MNLSANPAPKWRFALGVTCIEPETLMERSPKLKFDTNRPEVQPEIVKIELRVHRE